MSFVGTPLPQSPTGKAWTVMVTFSAHEAIKVCGGVSLVVTVVRISVVKALRHCLGIRPKTACCEPVVFASPSPFVARLRMRPFGVCRNWGGLMGARRIQGQVSFLQAGTRPQPVGLCDRRPLANRRWTSSSRSVRSFLDQWLKEVRDRERVGARKLETRAASHIRPFQPHAAVHRKPITKVWSGAHRGRVELLGRWYPTSKPSLIAKES